MRAFISLKIPRIRRKWYCLVSPASRLRHSFGDEHISTPLQAVALAQCTPFRLEIPPKAPDFAHAIEAPLTQAVFLSSPTTPAMSLWILLPMWIWLPLLIYWAYPPVTVDLSVKSWIFEHARKTKPVSIELCEPGATLCLCALMAAGAELSAIPHCATQPAVLRIEGTSPRIEAIFWILTGTEWSPSFTNAFVAVALKLVHSTLR